jgi:hypothetical protein
MKNAKQILLTLAGWLIVATAARAAAVGMVLDVQGSATADVAGRSMVLDMATPLNPAMRITLGKGSEMSFVVYPTREQVTARGPATLQVLEQAVKQLQGASPLQAKPLPENRSIAALGFQGRVVPAAMVMKAGFNANPRPTLLAPLDGETILAAQPTFVWTNPADGAVDFLLTLDGVAVHQQRVSGNQLVLPASIALIGGREYRWQVTAVGAQKATPARGTFTVPDAALREQMVRDEPAPDAALADWLLYAMALDQANMQTEAQRVWKRVAAHRPASSYLQSLTQ